jgi:hypothetical protein
MKMSDSHAEKMRTLVGLLHRKTAEKAIQWEPTGDTTNHRLTTTLGTNRVHIEYFSYRSGNSTLIDVKVTITNADGQITDTVTDSDLSGWFETPDDYSNWYQFMKEIIEMSERQLLKADDVLDDIIASLA